MNDDEEQELMAPHRYVKEPHAIRTIDWHKLDQDEQDAVTQALAGDPPDPMPNRAVQFLRRHHGRG